MPTTHLAILSRPCAVGDHDGCADLNVCRPCGCGCHAYAAGVPDRWLGVRAALDVLAERHPGALVRASDEGGRLVLHLTDPRRRDARNRTFADPQRAADWLAGFADGLGRR